MNKWYKDKQNIINILWAEENPDLVVEYKSMTANGEWHTMSEPLDIGDGVYTVTHTFVAVDIYLIRVVNKNTNRYLMDRVQVVENDLSEKDFNKLEQINSKRIFT